MFEKLIQLKNNKWAIRGGIGFFMVLVGILYIRSFDDAIDQSGVSENTPMPTPSSAAVSITIQPIPTIGLFTEELPFNVSYSFDEELPYETDRFTIVYPEFDIYTVYVHVADNVQVRTDVESWFTDHGADPSSLKIRYITQTDEQIISSIISELPVETENFRIDFSPKMELFVIILKGPVAVTSRKEAYEWFASKGLTDMTKINIWIEAGD